MTFKSHPKAFHCHLEAFRITLLSVYTHNKPIYTDPKSSAFYHKASDNIQEPFNRSRKPSAGFLENLKNHRNNISTRPYSLFRQLQLFIWLKKHECFNWNLATYNYLTGTPIPNWIEALVSALTNEFPANENIIWFLVIIFLPILGAILNFLLGRC